MPLKNLFNLNIYTMSVLVGKKAPKFSAQALINGGEFVENYSLEQFEGNKARITQIRMYHII